MTRGAASSLVRLRRVATLALLVAVPLVVWPGLALPFSTPKLWLIAGGAVALLALAAADGSLAPSMAAVPTGLRWAMLAWLASFAWSGMLAPYVSLESLVLGLAGPAWCMALLTSGVTVTEVGAALAAASGTVATVTLAQWLNHDPFVSAGWVPAIQGASARLRAYGTLGNPNFVAAWLAIAVPLVLATALRFSADRRRAETIAAAGCAALSMAAIAATGSRGGALGLAAGLASLAVFARVRRARWLAAAALVAAVVLPLVSTARPLIDTVAGRLYIWRVALPHTLDRPATGWGPGAFELVYHGWQGSREPTPEAAGFAGPQQRAHNDYLEALVERGVPGAAATCLLFVAAVMVFLRSRPGDGHVSAAGAAAGMMAAAAAAVVDFPLARPAEITAVWSAAAVLAIGASTAGTHTTCAGDTTRPTQEKKDAP